MSADNWTECPVCRGKYESAVVNAKIERDKVVAEDKPYGVVVEHNMRLQAALTALPKNTLRWDYEFYDAEEGADKSFKVTARIRLSCEVCKHSLSKDIVIDKDS